jgi:hypothetical protein
VVKKSGVTASPKTEIETGESLASGNSDVYAVFTVAAPAVYAGQQVEIESPQLEDRCGQGWRWEPDGGAAVNGVFPTTGAAISTLDNDGNAAFVFKGASCAAGTSTVVADVLAGTHPTYTTTFKIDPPSAKAAKKVATKVAAAKAAKKAAKDPISLTVSPTPAVEVGFTPSGDLSITKTDNDGGSSITSTAGKAVPGTSITYTIVASNNGSVTANVHGGHRPPEPQSGHNLGRLDGHRCRAGPPASLTPGQAISPTR